MAYQAISGEQLTESDINSVVNGVAGYGVWGGLAFSSGGSLYVIYTAGSYVDTAGAYHQIAAGSLQLSAAPGTGSARYDLLHVTGTAVSKTDGVAAPTASAAPNPVTPSGSIRLATYMMGAGVTQVVPTGFKDARIQLSARYAIQAYDMTAGNTTASSYTAMKTYNLSAAQCQYPYLIIRANGRFDVAAGAQNSDITLQARVAVGGTTKGNTAATRYLNNANVNGPTMNVPWSMLVVLVGGTDYTIGAATTVTIDGIVTVDAGSPTGTARYTSSEVVGVDL